MIIVREKATPEMAQALDEAGLSAYATLELPEQDLIRGALEQKVAEGGEFPVSVMIAVAKKLYGGDRSVPSELRY